MTVLLKKLIIYDANGKNATEITDDERVTVKISQGAKGSSMNITLKNAWQEHVENGEFKYAVDNIVKLWCAWATEGTDEIVTSSSDDLLMAADVIDVEAKGEENNVNWTLNCMDRTFIIMNKLFAKNYPLSESKNAPELIKEIINYSCGTGKGALSTSIKADLTEGQWVSNAFNRTGGGYIQRVRPDNSAFPVVSIAKVFKPVYEWIEDLSQSDMTNTSTELAASGQPPAYRPYYFYIDENNNCHWEFPDNTTPSYHMTWGQTAAVSPDTINHYITAFSLKRAVFDIVNMVIFNAGVDYYGSGILSYYYDKATTSPKLKPIYKPWVDIASKAIYHSIFDAPPDGNSDKFTEDNTTPGTLTFQGKRYTATTPFTPYWSSTSVANDSELNDSLRDYCIMRGQSKADSLTSRKASPRWKGTITIRGEKINIGELIQFNSADHGIINALVRVTDVQHTIDKNSWTTSLSVEEDAEGIENG